MKRYLLAHDLGTSGDKAVLFDTKSMEIVSDKIVTYNTFYPEEGWVEHDSNQWWHAVCNSTKSLIEESSISPNEIAAVSFSAIMNSCLPVDSNGNPLRNAMIWCDQRGETEVESLYNFASEDCIYEKTGHRINGTYALTKMLWFKKNQPELYSRTYQFLQAKDYIIYKLTGVFATDFSDASHLGVLDQKNKCYWEDLLSFIQFPVNKLPQLKTSTEIVGYVTNRAARETGLAEGTPIVMGGGDGCCATAGAGSYKPGMGYSTLGTSAWNGNISENMALDNNKITFSFIHLDGKRHVSIGTMQSAGHSIEWLLSVLNPRFNADKANIYVNFNRMVNESLEQNPTTRLLYYPFLLGERSPWWNSEARGCFIGLEASTTSTEMFRSCLEGIAFNLKVILDAMEKSDAPLDMRIIGGGARNSALLNIIASAWNRPITVPKYSTEATSLGAILCAGIGAGLIKDFSSIETINPPDQVYYPNQKLVKHYQKLFTLFKESYKDLAQIFHKQKEI